MTQYQRITLKESGEEFVVDKDEYLLDQRGIPHVKFVVYQEMFAVDSETWKNRPVKFLTLQPQDILKREEEWTEAGEYELITAAEAAAEREMIMREMYRKRAEEEMEHKAAMINPPVEEGGDSEGLFA